MQRHLKVDFVKPTFQATRSGITNANTLYMEDVEQLKTSSGRKLY